MKTKLKIVNDTVYWTVREVVEVTVSWDLYRAVGEPVYEAVREDVSGAVNGAVGGAVRETVNVSEL